MQRAPVILKQPYDWSFQVYTRKQPGKGWRQRLAFALRRLAQRIDGLAEFVLVIDTSPRLATDQLAMCIERGFKAMEEAVVQEVRSEAIELAMRRYAPHLYEAVE